MLPTLAAAGLLPRDVLADDETLFLYNWDDYMSDATLESFTALTGAAVNMDLFADNEELFAKLRLGKSGYDVALPTHDTVERMWQNGLVESLDHARIPNLANLGPLHQDPTYDPGNRHSVPYMWGYMGLAYRKSAVARPTSWRDVLTAAGLKRNGRVAWLSESSSVYSVASMMLGGGASDFSPAMQERVFAEIMPAKRELTAIAADNGEDLLAAGEVDITMEWNGEIAVLIEEDPDIGFVIPDEGSIHFVDCMVIPAGAPHPQLAHRFMNHILDPQVGSELAEWIGYPTPNAAALAAASAEYRANEVTFPPAGSRLQTPDYPGEEALARLNGNWEKMLTS